MSVENYKYKTRLHSLIAKGPVPSRRAWQDSILSYITQHCSVDNDVFKSEKKKSFFVSPLPVNVVPKKSLVDELRTEENGFIPIVFAAYMNCPSDVLAAMCHLFPQGASVPYKDGSLSLHLAARQATGTAGSGKPDPHANDNLRGISILVEAYPMALIKRDEEGRTPLHVVLENHAATRHVELIERLGRAVDEKVWRYEVEAPSEEEEELVRLPVPTVVREKFPDEEEDMDLPDYYVPASAMAIPDRLNGALPIHYAAKNGAPKEVISALIKGFPHSAAAEDHLERTPLHWVFGAEGSTVPTGYAHETIPMHHFHRSSNIINVFLEQKQDINFDLCRKKDIHVSGRPHRTPLHYAIELLSNNILSPAPSRGDGKGPASCITIKSLQTLINRNKEALLEKDALGLTPLHILFRSAFQKNSLEYTKMLHIVETGAVNVEPPKEPSFFSPPAVLLDLLMEEVEIFESDPNFERTQYTSIKAASDIVDLRGLLPLHYAVLVGATPKVINQMIAKNPKSLTQLSRGNSAKDDKFIRKYYDFVAENNPFFVSSFEASRTPLHMAFASPYMTKLYTTELISNLLRFQAVVEVDDHENLDSLGNPTKKSKNLDIDGTIALKMQDAGGNTPLHLAAKNNASLEMLQFLMKYDSEVCMFPNNNGQLPLHLLLDKNFLWVNADLALAHSTKDYSKSDVYATQQTPEFREKVRELAKKQTMVMRMQKYDLCGAVFAPTTGWTGVTDEEVTLSENNCNTMKKINMFATAILRHKQSLSCVDNIHGMSCIQILVAFNAAPYKVLVDILKSCPESALGKTTKDNYSVFDIHMLRKSIPNEVRKEEIDAWKAVKELLFAYCVFPLDVCARTISGPIHNARQEKELLTSLENQLLAEISGEGNLSMHTRDNHPVDPIHVKLGFFDKLKMADDQKDDELSVVTERFWVFVATFVNLENPMDQYASYIESILEKLTFVQMERLVKMEMPSWAFKRLFTLEWDTFGYTIDNYANIYAKVYFHKYYNFAGLYDFTPTSNTSILLHRGSTNQSVNILATRKEFKMLKPADAASDFTWMFDPATDVKKRSDYSIEESKVVFKFMTNRYDYEREIKWRKELCNEDSKAGIKDEIVPILSHLDPTAIDGEIDKKYAEERVGARFKAMPLYSKEIASGQTIDLTVYPYALVFPYAAGGTMQDSMTRGTLTPSEAKLCAYKMGLVLDELHQCGLVHGSFSPKNILAFFEGENGEEHLKLGGLSSVTPMDQDLYKQGAISAGGKCLFDYTALTPEMFMKVNTTQLQKYNIYWQLVREIEGVTISEEVIKPRFDPITSETYVLKCYCNHEKAETLNYSLPYDLASFDRTVDVWAFGVLLFTLLSGGESLFQPNQRTGRVTSMELLAKWDANVAESIVSQYITDLAAQDLLLHILVPKEDREKLSMKTILSHPFFSDEIHEEIIMMLKKAKDERNTILKLKRREAESKNEFDNVEPLHIGRLTMKNQLRMTNSAHQAIKECFDKSGIFTSTAPYTYMLLPYELAPNAEGRLFPKSNMEMDIALRLGRQLLDLCKVVGFAACYSETLSTKSKSFQKFLSNLFLVDDADLAEIGQELLATFHLDRKDYNEVATKFAILVKDVVNNDPDTFITNPMKPVVDLLSHFITNILNTFSVTGLAHMYLVDEFSSSIAWDPAIESPYPHVFKEHVSDLVLKSLPYMHACVSSGLCAEDGPEGLLKILAEGLYPEEVPETWDNVFAGIPTIPIKRRMVAEAKILHQVCHQMIPKDSPIALNGESEPQFLSSLYSHIDKGKTYAGLRPITDDTGTMWVSVESRRTLLLETAEESRPERIYELYAREEAEMDKMEQKDIRIAQLEKELRKSQRKIEELRKIEI